MRTKATEMFGIDFPLFAFSHCRDVVAAVTNAGGLGVLGAAGLSPAQLEVELTWIDEHVDGKPYGADILVPEKVEGKGRGLKAEDFAAMVPEQHQQFVAGLLSDHDVPPPEHLINLVGARMGSETNNHDLLEVAFAHPVAMVANALGRPPEFMLEMAHSRNIPVAALVGARHHAERQLAAGVDLLIAQGGEAGGHTGSIATMVLVPEVVAAVEGRVPVLAAGGIVTGRQMAAAVAMGADGAWTGSLWLTTEEAETAPVTKQKFVEATSADTIRSRGRTGKPARQLRSDWTDAWEAEDAPKPLPMPLQSMIAEPALRRVDESAASGKSGARELATYFVGQGVGMMNAVKPASRVVMEMMEDFAEAAERLEAVTGDTSVG